MERVIWLNVKWISIPRLIYDIVEVRLYGVCIKLHFNEDRNYNTLHFAILCSNYCSMWVLKQNQEKWEEKKGQRSIL